MGFLVYISLFNFFSFFFFKQSDVFQYGSYVYYYSLKENSGQAHMHSVSKYIKSKQHIYNFNHFLKENRNS